MRIDSSAIGMESARRYTASGARIGRYTVMDYSGKSYRKTATGGTGDMFGNLLDTESEQDGTKGTSEQGTTDSLTQAQTRLSSMGSSRISLRSQWSSLDSIRQLSIRFVFSLLFGSSRTQSIFGDNSVSMLGNQSYEEWRNQYYASQNSSVSMGQGGSQQFLVYSNQVSFYESETTSFQAGGTVRTADGREINFNVDVSMSREFASYYEQNYGLDSIRTCDPLVINLNGDVAGLSDQKFLFDIDGDGVKDQVSMLNSGSGYLALDKNGDGIINDGNELFGPQSGNGFADLAAYDEDGNGWIDENDSIWSQLKIWCKTESGEDQLYTLADKGVGAICLQNAATDFALNGAANQPNGYIRSTGIFLYENGNVGTVQHVDLTQ